MAYNIMLRLIKMPIEKRKANDELKDMCDVYYAAGRLTSEQYNELISLIG